MQEILPPEKPLRVRHDGWTAARQEEFLDALKREGSVAAACGVVGMSTTSAYNARTRIRGFRNRWDDALADVKPRIEAEVMRRAVEGWDEPVFHAGKQVGVKRKYSDSLLRMAALRGTQLPDVSVQNIPIEEVERELLRRLDSLARQHQRRQAADAAAAKAVLVAEADDLRERGLCP